MIVTQIAFSTIILLGALAFVLVALEEDVRPVANWLKLSRVDRVLVLIMTACMVALFVGTLAFIWGL
jgi:hypothetical protein